MSIPREHTPHPTLRLSKVLLGACLVLTLAGVECKKIPNTNVVITSPLPGDTFSAPGDVTVTVSVQKLLDMEHGVDGVELP